MIIHKMVCCFILLVVLLYTVEVLDGSDLGRVLAPLQTEQGGLLGETSKGIVISIDTGGSLIDCSEPGSVIHLGKEIAHDLRQLCRITDALVK